MAMRSTRSNSWVSTLLDYSAMLVHLYNDVLPLVTFLWSTTSLVMIVLSSLLVLGYIWRKELGGQVLSPLAHIVYHQQQQLQQAIGRIFQQGCVHLVTIISRGVKGLFINSPTSSTTTYQFPTPTFDPWMKGTGNVRLHTSPSNWIGLNAFWKWRRLKRLIQSQNRIAASKNLIC